MVECVFSMDISWVFKGMTELTFGNHLPVFGEADMNGSGKLLANCEMMIKDLTSGALLGLDQPGEIYIKGCLLTFR